MADETNRNETQQQDLGELLRIRREKLKALQDEGRDPFQITKFDVTHHTQDIKDNFDAMEGTEVSVAGRLMSKRGMGKVSFCDLQDKNGRIQIYARVPHPAARDVRPRQGDHAAEQVSAPPAREVPRPYRQGDPLPSAVRGPYHEPREQA